MKVISHPFLTHPFFFSPWPKSKKNGAGTPRVLPYFISATESQNCIFSHFVAFQIDEDVVCYECIFIVMTMLPKISVRRMYF
jgi:hypothetical protein